MGIAIASKSHHNRCDFGVLRDRANGRGGFGSQTAADAPATPEKQTAVTVTASHKMLTVS